MNHRFTIMPLWEVRMRLNLELELPDQGYTIKEGPWVMHTGKQGFIDFHVEMAKAVRR